MAIKKSPAGRWQVDIQPGGRGHKRVRKSFDTKAEARRFELHVAAQVQAGQPWQPLAKDRRRLSDLVRRWHDLHGRNLKDAENRRRHLDNIVAHLGNPIASAFTARHFADYRADRLSEGISPNTINHDHAYIRAVFNELARLGEWDAVNPLATVRRLKVVESELSYLTHPQILLLLDRLEQGDNDSAPVIARVCLATGARWSEAESLCREDILPGKVRYMGKNGRYRYIPIASDLERVLTDRADTGPLFEPAYNAFRYALERSGIELPDGQMTHVLRHTFASHFMQSGGSILTLQRILDHSSLTMTMRYAHMAPDHLTQALDFNPLAKLARQAAVV